MVFVPGICAPQPPSTPTCYSLALSSGHGDQSEPAQRVRSTWGHETQRSCGFIGNPGAMTLPRVPWEFDSAVPGHFNRVWREILLKEERQGRIHTVFWWQGPTGSERTLLPSLPHTHLFAITSHSHTHALGLKGAHLFFPTSRKECLPGNFGAMYFFGW